MKKHSTQTDKTRLLMLFIALFLMLTGANAQISFQEDFNYPAGTGLHGQGGWGKYGSNPNAPITVEQQELSYDGYPGGVKGNMTLMHADATAEDLLVRFDPNDDGVKQGCVYYSALIRVTEAPQKGNAYVMALLPRTKSSVIQGNMSPTELGRLFIGTGSDATHFKMGVDRGAQNPVMAGTEYETGKTYLIVVKYQIKTDGMAGDMVYLFVNPASYTQEPATADAEISPSATGSGVGSYGLQGFELRQGTTSKATAPVMNVGALRISDTYAGLFSTDGGGGTDTPQATLTGDLNFGALYMGTKLQKTVRLTGKNLKGDVTITTSQECLKAEPAVITAADAEAGTDITLTLSPTAAGEGSATVTLKSEGMEDAVLTAQWTAVATKEISSLSAFAGENADEGNIYIYTGQAVVTFVDKSQTPNVYYLQDNDGGTTLKDSYGMMTATYGEGDMLTGFTVMIEQAFGINSLIPLTADLGTLVSKGNTATAKDATLAELKDNPQGYINRLVRVKNATFSNVAEGAVFAEGMAQPIITDATGEGKVRIFKGTSLIGTAIPEGEANVTGIMTSMTAVLVAPRGAADIEPLTVLPPALEVTPAKLETAGGLVGKETVMGKLHVKATSLPGAVDIYITGTHGKMFTTDVTTIPAGSSETDITVTYTPTATGKHTGRVNIDCTQMPELTQAVTLSAYATDENNPPQVTVSPATLDPFTTVVGTPVDQTLTVTTAHLPDYASIRVKEPGVFTINNSILLKDATAQIKVTFNPKEAGIYENAIEITGLAIETITIPLKGTATDNGNPPGGDKEGDELPLDTSNPLTLLQETFDNVEQDKPLKIEGWKNVAMEGTRAWWGHVFPDFDESAGEKAAKVTPYDSNVTLGEEQPCTMLLATPPLDFKNSASKIFTFRVRGNFLRDEQNDLLELCYMDMLDGEMYIAPVGGFSMPALADQNGEWQEYHIDLTGQEIADVFFMGFRFKSMRGRENSATYYIDDVTYGRTDLPAMHPSPTQLAFTAVAGKDAASPEVEVTAENLQEPIKLSLGGANKSKFKLSVSELPATGGKFTVMFNSNDIGVHEAYVKLASRGAADVYVPVSVRNDETSGINTISGTAADITVFDLEGRKLRHLRDTTAEKALDGLAPGTYVLKADTAEGTVTVKVSTARKR